MKLVIVKQGYENEVYDSKHIWGGYKILSYNLNLRNGI